MNTIFWYDNFQDDNQKLTSLLLLRLPTHGVSIFFITIYLFINSLEFWITTLNACVSCCLSEGGRLWWWSPGGHVSPVPWTACCPWQASCKLRIIKWVSEIYCVYCVWKNIKFCSYFSWLYSKTGQNVRQCEEKQ